MRRPLHYWRIHARVSRRLWTDISQSMRDTIAADAGHETETYKWFEKKVNEDTEKLFQDPNYYDNCPYSFRMSRTTDPLAA